MNLTLPVALSVVALALPGTAFAVARPHIEGSATVYVATTGDDGHDCSAPDAAHVCKTIQHAAVGAETGSIVQIAAGTYNESVATIGAKSLKFQGAGPGTLDNAAGATVVTGDDSGPPFTLRGGGGLKDLRLAAQSGAHAGTGATLDAGGGNNNQYNVENVIAIAGVADGGTSPAAIRIDSTGTGSHVTVISTDTIANAPGTSSSGILAVTDDSTDAIDASFTHLTASGANIGVDDEAQAGQMSFTDSTISAAPTGRYGINAYSPVTVTRSVVHGGTDPGVVIVGNSRLTMVDSLVTAAPSDPSNTHAAVIILNTVAGTYTSTITGSTIVAAGGSADAAGLYTQSSPNTTPNVNLVNTIVRAAAANGTPAAGQKDILTGTSGGSGGTITASHSSFSTSQVTSGTGTVPAPGSGTNITGDPGFKAWGSDYTLLPTSPLVDAADPAKVAADEKDVTGVNARSIDGNGDCQSSPDIGAYELTGHAGSNPAVVIGGPAAIGKKPVTLTATPATGYSLAWAFSDGPTATGATVPRTFTKAGPITATVTATHGLCTGQAARTFTVDLTPPSVTRLKPSPISFTPAKSGGSVVTKGGTKISFNVSEAATLTFSVEKALKGRSTKGKCGAPTKKNVNGKSCTYYVKVAGSFTKAVTKAGAATLRFSGRIGGHTLPKGSYRLDVVGTDAVANKAAKPATASFHIS